MTFETPIKAKVLLKQANKEEIESEVTALTERTRPDGYPLRVIGMRELRSENSWMHNAPILMRGEREQRALMHADDAAELGVDTGDTIRVSSLHGHIELPVKVTRDIVVGVVAIPHGWGHRGTGTLRVANRAGGANINELMSSDPNDIERLAFVGDRSSEDGMAAFYKPFAATRIRYFDEDKTEEARQWIYAGLCVS